MTDPSPYAEMLAGIDDPEIVDAFGDLFAYIDRDRTTPEEIEASRAFREERLRSSLERIATWTPKDWVVAEGMVRAAGCRFDPETFEDNFPAWFDRHAWPGSLEARHSWPDDFRAEYERIRAES